MTCGAALPDSASARPSHTDESHRARIMGDATVGTFEAKTHLSELLERVRRGERITITKRGVAVAVMVPAAEAVRDEVAAVADHLARLRSRTRPGRESIRELRDEGRR